MIDNRFKFRFWDNKTNKMLYPDENNKYRVGNLKLDLGEMLKWSEDIVSRFRPMQNIGLTKCNLYEKDLIEVTIDGKKVKGLIEYYGDLPYYHLIVDYLGTDWRPINDGWIYDGYIIGNYYEGEFKEKVKICNKL